MSEPLYIWATNRARNPNACQYYRLDLPMMNFHKMGLGICYQDDGSNDDEALRAMLTSDVAILYSVGGEGALHQVNTIRDIKANKTADDILRIPPLVLYDVDDNTDFVHPMNFTFSYLGIRSYPDAKLLEPGNTLEWEDADHERRVLWEDKVTTGNGLQFDIARNLHQMKVRHELIQRCHGATVSTPALASYFKEVIGQPNTYVFPNSVDLSHYEFYDVARKDPSKIRILWQGSMSHYVDWYPLREAVREISQKYKNQITWVIFGEWFDWVHDMIPDEIVEFHPWTHYQAYKLKRGLLNIDINLCPLANNAFNRCKSAIKWYEGSIWNQPEATLAANTEPYFEIKDGKTGLLFNSPEEFVQKLGQLIENKDLRTKISQNAKKWVLENRTPEKTIPALYDFYTELKDRQKSELNPRIVLARR